MYTHTHTHNKERNEQKKSTKSSESIGKKRQAESETGKKLKQNLEPFWRRWFRLITVILAEFEALNPFTLAMNPLKCMLGPKHLDRLNPLSSQMQDFWPNFRRSMCFTCKIAASCDATVFTFFLSHFFSYSLSLSRTLAQARSHYHKDIKGTQKRIIYIIIVCLLKTAIIHSKFLFFWLCTNNKTASERQIWPNNKLAFVLPSIVTDAVTKHPVLSLCCFLFIWRSVDAKP